MTTTTTTTTARLFQRSLRSLSASRNASILLGFSSTTVVTLCDDDKNKILKKQKDGSMDWDATMDSIATQVGNKVQSAVETGIPTQVSYGFVCGYCSGYALKKIGKAGAIVFGLGFMTLQTLQYSGYITVDHNRMKNEVTKWMDLNEDGKVDKEDTDIAYKKVLAVLEYNMPAGGGFGAGFIGGIRSG